MWALGQRSLALSSQTTDLVQKEKNISARRRLHLPSRFRRGLVVLNAVPEEVGYEVVADLHDGADAHCAALAKAAGSKETNWKAYLSTTLPKGDAGENAREPIGKGPWHNAKGVMVAKSVADLHSDNVNINKQTGLTEKGEVVGGSGDKPNQHDILTGSDPQGMFSTAGGDTTCGNWTNSGGGSAIVGHHDRSGLKKTSRHMTSWNSSHGSRGCSQDNLISSGGAGLLYCFVAN